MVVDVSGHISADAYTAPLIYRALKLVAPQLHVTDTTDTTTKSLDAHHPLLQILPYEAINFEHHLSHPSTSLANSYIIRKALIRKHHLWQTVSSWWSKHPADTALKHHIPLTVTFELDYAEFLDDALVECFELHESFAKDAREWWVLKPAMSDQGQGVRLFSSFEELQAIFEEWEVPEDGDADAEEDNEIDEHSITKFGDETETHIDATSTTTGTGSGTMTSQLRHFIAQRYVDPPLLFPEHGNRKFHIRTYVLAVGALKVYVYKEMLALFASEPYQSPPTTMSSNGSSSHEDDGEATSASNPNLDLRVHLTNTCLQHDDDEDDNGSSSPSTNNGKSSSNENPKAKVLRFWDLPNDLPTAQPHTSPTTTTPTSSNTDTKTDTNNWKSSTFTQILSATSTLFEAAAREQMIHFQTLPNSFEIFGLDWIVSSSSPSSRDPSNANANANANANNVNNDVDDVDVDNNDVNIYLLEVNAYPDFKQSGAQMQDVIAGLWEEVVRVGIVPFFREDLDREDGGVGADDEDDDDDGKGGRDGAKEGGEKMVKVLDVDLGRR